MIQKIILGCGNFGGIGSSPALLGKGENTEQTTQILKDALDLGITRFDTANTYCGGQSERIVVDFFAENGSSTRLRIELHTTYSLNQDFPAESRLSLIADPYKRYLTAENFGRIRELKVKALENKRSLSQEALHFILDSHDVNFVIIGPRKRVHYENLGFKFNRN